MDQEKASKAWEAMNDKQRDIYENLLGKRTFCRKAVARHGDFYVKVDHNEDTIYACPWEDVNDAIADIVLAQTKDGEEPKSITEMNDEELLEEARAKAWRTYIPGVTSWLSLTEEIYCELKEARDNAQNRT